MQEPPGYESLREFVKLLLKAIYGLKQAAVKWYCILYKVLIDLGFCISTADLVSPPKHVAKLPYWSEPWYHLYRRDLACHIYVSYVSSLISHLPPLTTPHFGSEAEPDVLFFLLLPRGSARHP